MSVLRGRETVRMRIYVCAPPDKWTRFFAPRALRSVHKNASEKKTEEKNKKLKRVLHSHTRDYFLHRGRVLIPRVVRVPGGRKRPRQLRVSDHTHAVNSNVPKRASPSSPAKGAIWKTRINRAGLINLSLLSQWEIAGDSRRQTVVRVPGHRFGYLWIIIILFCFVVFFKYLCFVVRTPCWMYALRATPENESLRRKKWAEKKSMLSRRGWTREKVSINAGMGEGLLNEGPPSERPIFFFGSADCITVSKKILIRPYAL